MNETAEKILSILEKSSGPVSGEDISRQLGITRSAVWKQINELKNLGYTINSSRTEGYELAGSTSLLLPHEIEKYLKTKFIGRNICYFDNAPSTSWIAHDIIKKQNSENLDGTAVIAEEQTGGVGRLGRAWFSPRGGIWTTLVLKPKVPIERLFFVTMAGSIAVARSIRNMYGIGALIKWPNDIYIGDKKISGILLELSAEADQIHYCLLGIGIDANIKPEEFQGGMRTPVTSLNIETGEDINRAKFLAAFFMEFERRYELVENGEYDSITREWKSLSLTLEKRVKITTPRRTIEGEAMDIDSHGALIIKKDNGMIEKVFSGDCTPV
ncbi:BirA family biotin operon repressor/biotin-[acetyl-CoA-carboxylase] ligase [Methanomicrobium sp. W14]|uniref:biotin--[acetyl-CoA-carboxylase] ligase n=1 Tax=Methanomicrobium sp. W14 TaxID=2817839 RepID=UPI001AE9775E|nr:biotin--[acetyl-CoA-carboxylase] ligase [Methanomicrobium sp. W14]MBP2132794.1 BirA family biotin operon repressor/biotin-[acetyl-CoA-carboxylase] ligase [Methanomicrobium sp. W14]